MIMRLLRSETRKMPRLYMREADDGLAAIELLREEMDIALRSPGRGFDVIFMDSVMVWTAVC